MINKLDSCTSVGNVGQGMITLQGIHASPPKDGGGLTFSGNLKSLDGPVLKCRGRRTREFY